MLPLPPALFGLGNIGYLHYDHYFGVRSQTKTHVSSPVTFVKFSSLSQHFSKSLAVIIWFYLCLPVKSYGTNLAET